MSIASGRWPKTGSAAAAWGNNRPQPRIPHVRLWRRNQQAREVRMCRVEHHRLLDRSAGLGWYEQRDGCTGGHPRGAERLTGAALGRVPVGDIIFRNRRDHHASGNLDAAPFARGKPSDSGVRKRFQHGTSKGRARVDDARPWCIPAPRNHRCADPVEIGIPRIAESIAMT